MTQSAEIVSSGKVIAPHKARIVVLLGAVFLLHAALLLLFWPHHWPNKYKWLLLPDSLGAYCLIAFGVEQLKSKTNSEHEAHKSKTKGHKATSL